MMMTTIRTMVKKMRTPVMRMTTMMKTSLRTLMTAIDRIAQFPTRQSYPQTAPLALHPAATRRPQAGTPRLPLL